MRIDLKDHAEFGKYLDMGLKAVLAKALHGTATRIVQDITTQIIPGEAHPPVDRGVYRGGWRVDVQPGVIYIVNTTKQAPIIERGVRPGNVKPGRMMIIALKGWVQRKGLAARGGGDDGPKRNAKGHFLKSKPSNDAVSKIAWAIAMSMKGSAGKPGTGIFRGGDQPGGLRILERAMRKFDDYFQQEFVRELKKVGGR